MTESRSIESRKLSLVRRLTGILLASCLAVIVFEGFLRLVDYAPPRPNGLLLGRFETDFFVFDPQVIWRFPKDPEARWGPIGSIDRGNTLGCRGYEPTPEKSANSLRILSVGASVVAGFALPFEKSFTIRLERRIQRLSPGLVVESVLGGLPGYSSEQQKELLETKLDGFEPDLVLILTGSHNDFMPSFGRADQEIIASFKPTQTKTFDLIRHCLSSIGAANKKQPSQKEYEKVSEQIENSETRVPLERFSTNLNAMLDWCDQKGAEAVVILPAAKDQLAIRKPYRQAVIDVARKKRKLTVDLQEIAPDFMHWYDQIHLSDQGHDALSAAIFAAIEKRGLLKQWRKRSSKQPLWITFDKKVPTQATSGIAKRMSLKIHGVRPEELLRIWCAGFLIDFEWMGDEGIELQLPHTLPPGPAELEFVTKKGTQLFSRQLQIAAPKLHVARVSGKHGNGLRMAVEVSGPTRISFAVREHPPAEPIHTGIGPVWVAKSSTFPPKDQTTSQMLRRSTFCAGETVSPGLVLATWIGESQFESGETVVIQGFLSPPYTDRTSTPFAITEPVYLTIP